MSITAKELAEKLNLSPAAVSLALNNKQGVSTATRVRVIRAAKKYGYDFVKYKDFIKDKAVYGTIHFVIYKKCGAIVSDTPFFAELSQGIDENCKKEHYKLNIHYIYDNDNIQSMLEDFNENNCAGIIILGTEMSESDLRQFLTVRVPFVVLDTYFENISCNYVLINNHQGAYKATQYLLKKCGNKIGYLSSSYRIANFEERVSGFYKAMRCNGLSPSNAVIHELAPSLEGAYADMCCLIESGEKLADSYFADNDLIAYGAIRAFKEHGYRIPEDISVIGFDDIPISSYMEPTLSTINVQVKCMGQTAVKRLVELIQEIQTSTFKIELSTELIVRESVIQ